MSKTANVTLLGLLTFFTAAQSFADSLPSSIPIRESRVELFSKASFDFSMPHFPHPVIITFRSHTSDEKSHGRIREMIIAYGHENVIVAEALLADIQTPDFLTLSVSAVRVVASNETVISVFLFDESPNCAVRVEKQCGLVEFDWTVGGKVEKLDRR
jgi:hypothetical protein